MVEYDAAMNIKIMMMMMIILMMMMMIVGLVGGYNLQLTIFFFSLSFITFYFKYITSHYYEIKYLIMYVRFVYF